MCSSADATIFSSTPRPKMPASNPPEKPPVADTTAAYAPPSHSDVLAQTLEVGSRALRLGRLRRLQATFAVALSVLVGSMGAVQFCFGLGQFGGLEYAARVLVLSSVRTFGPQISVSAACLALLVWTHQTTADAVRPNLLRAAPWSLPMVVIGTMATIATTIGSGLVVIHWAYDVSWSTIAASRSELTAADIPPALKSVALNASLASAFCWFALPEMARRTWSLTRKIGAWSGGAVIAWCAFELANAVTAA